MSGDQSVRLPRKSLQIYVTPACSKPFLKGRRVHFAARTGLRIARVCSPCADGGVTVVQDRSANPHACTNCEKRPAVLCSPCALAIPRGDK